MCSRHARERNAGGAVAGDGGCHRQPFGANRQCRDDRSVDRTSGTIWRARHRRGCDRLLIVGIARRRRRVEPDLADLWRNHDRHPGRRQRQERDLALLCARHRQRRRSVAVLTGRDRSEFQRNCDPGSRNLFRQHRLAGDHAIGCRRPRRRRSLEPAAALRAGPAAGNERSGVDERHIGRECQLSRRLHVSGRRPAERQPDNGNRQRRHLHRAAVL